MERLKLRTVAKVVANISTHDVPIGSKVFVNSYVGDGYYRIIDSDLWIWKVKGSELEPLNEAMKIAKNLGKPKK